ncbi:hypothetical protein RND81_01G124200 [Saponaria officinalis]|uniref:Auxin-responsive protein n=1 Tax=Saponaria officinalis TaxID=3572 RepID=A0AAW1N9M1_SAPOF
MELTTGSSDSSTIDQQNHHNFDQIDQKMVGFEFEDCDESNELELGLGLSLGVLGSSKSCNFANKNMQIPRILTAKDLNSSRNVVVVSTSSSSTESSVKSDNVCVGTKRAASPTAVSQVVGWPPIRSYRMNSMANQAKSIATSENNSQFDETKGKKLMYDAEDKGNANSKDKLPHKSSLFVKVNMDGVAIGRKVDLASHSSYESLARTLEEMFTNNDDEKSNAEELILMPKVTRPSKLLDGTSDFVLTYEDKDGDWMLVGDVPWGMFVMSVKRLKVMRTSEANGLAPRSEDRSSKQKRRPI